MYVLSYLVPKDKNLFLYGGFDCSKFGDSSKYLFIYANKNLPATKNYWVTQSKETAKLVRGQGYKTLKKDRPCTLWKLIRAKALIIVSGDSDLTIMPLLGKFRIFNTWHGHPIKKIGLDDKMYTDMTGKSLVEKLNCNIFKKQLSQQIGMLSINKEMTEIYKSAFKGNKHILEFGYPRHLPFFDRSYLVENLKEKLELEKYKKVFVYMPTFRSEFQKEAKFPEEDLAELNKVLKEMGSVLLYKYHHHENNKVMQEMSNIKNATDFVSDANELLVYADVVITDYSSVFFDYLILKKPVIFFPYDLRRYKEKSRDMYYEYEEIAPGPFVYTLAELAVKIKTINELEGDSEYMQKIAKLNQRINTFSSIETPKKIFDYLLNN